MDTILVGRLYDRLLSLNSTHWDELPWLQVDTSLSCEEVSILGGNALLLM